MIPANDQPSAMTAAADWTTALLQSGAVTAIAGIAVLGIAFAMMAGKVQFRRAAVTVLGCFVLFGAASVASALLSLAAAQGDRAPHQAAIPKVKPTLAESPSKAMKINDPYAGASVPSR